MNETIKTILNRRSFRAYQPEQIKDQDLQAILEAGKFAPSGMNTQPWHFSVIQNKALLTRINGIVKAALIKSGNSQMAGRAKAENFNIFYEAPTLIIVSGDPKVATPQFDCALALGNMLLAAASLGVSSCWIHAVSQIFNPETLQPILKEIGIPEGYQIYCSGVFGYQAGETPAPARRKEGTVNIIT